MMVFHLHTPKMVILFTYCIQIQDQTHQTNEVAICTFTLQCIVFVVPLLHSTAPTQLHHTVTHLHVICYMYTCIDINWQNYKSEIV